MAFINPTNDIFGNITGNEPTGGTVSNHTAIDWDKLKEMQQRTYGGVLPQNYPYSGAPSYHGYDFNSNRLSEDHRLDDDTVRLLKTLLRVILDADDDNQLKKDLMTALAMDMLGKEDN